MREIEFRAKAITTGEWVYGLTIAKGTIKRKRDCWYFEISENNYTQVDPETIGQYSGEKDKHGNKLYDGDICVRPYMGDRITKGVIEFRYGAFVFQSKENPAEQVVGWSLIRINTGEKWDDNKNVKDLERIGNIHDNPELLPVF